MSKKIGKKTKHMTIEETIKKAMEGGWNPVEAAKFFQSSDGWRVQIGDHFTLDPSFWQSLGKAMGWKHEFPSIRRCSLSREGVQELKSKGHLKDVTTGRITGESRDKQCWHVRWDGKRYTQSLHKDFVYEFPTDWKMWWRRFIDHLAEGKDAQSFFETL